MGFRGVFPEQHLPRGPSTRPARRYDPAPRGYRLFSDRARLIRYGIIPLLTGLTLVAAYFSGVDPLMNLVARRGQREYGAVENLQNLLLILIAVRAWRAAGLETAPRMRYLGRALSVFAVFVLMEELDWGDHYYRSLTGKLAGDPGEGPVRLEIEGTGSEEGRPRDTRQGIAGTEEDLTIADERLRLGHRPFDEDRSGPVAVVGDSDRSDALDRADARQDVAGGDQDFVLRCGHGRRGEEQRRKQVSRFHRMT